MVSREQPTSPQLQFVGQGKHSQPRSSGSRTADFNTHTLKPKGFPSAPFQSEDSHGRTHLSLGTELPEGQPSEAARRLCPKALPATANLPQGKLAALTALSWAALTAGSPVVLFFHFAMYWSVISNFHYGIQGPLWLRSFYSEPTLTDIYINYEIFSL